MQRALAAAPNASQVEQALIRSLPARYPQREAIEDQTTWDKAFTVEMRKLFHAHPNDLDLRSVFAEAIMNETPWQMWDLKTGQPTPGAGTEEAVEVLVDQHLHQLVEVDVVVTGLEDPGGPPAVQTRVCADDPRRHAREAQGSAGLASLGPRGPETLIFKIAVEDPIF